MSRRWLAVPLVTVLVVGCGPAPVPAVSVAPTDTPASPSSTHTTAPPTAAPSPSNATRELTTGSGPLPAGSYTRSRFRPPVTLALDEGWSTGTLTDGFFDVQQEGGTPDVIAVQFARVEGLAGSSGTMTDATTAAAAVATIRQNAALTVIDESASRLGGLVGLNVVVENRGAAHAAVMRVLPGALGIDPGRRLWIALFDSRDGLLAVMVGGSVTEWERALTLAEPVLESVVVGG